MSKTMQTTDNFNKYFKMWSGHVSATIYEFAALSYGNDPLRDHFKDTGGRQFALLDAVDHGRLRCIGQRRTYAPMLPREGPLHPVDQELDIREATFFAVEYAGWVIPDVMRMAFLKPAPPPVHSARDQAEAVTQDEMTGKSTAGKMVSEKSCKLQDTKPEAGHPRGIPSATIIEKFRLTSEWENRLKHWKRYNYLKPPLLVQPGARGNGNGKNLWNPARFAVMLRDKQNDNQKRLHTIIENHFVEWFDEWCEISGWNDV